jgi:hypothetical protein
MMMNKLETPNAIKRDTLNKAHYFRSILEKACSLNLLTDRELANIQRQSAELLARQIERYSGEENSSVKVETAQNMMESIFYAIGTYLKSMPSPESGIKALKQQSLLELYRHGKKLIRTYFESARELFHAVQKSAICTDNDAYNDTMRNGIPLFFSCYDIDYAAHESPGSIDYPLSNDKMELTGIEYIFDYLQKLYLENRFCNYFTKHDLDDLLHGYDKQYQHLLINIFGLALTNALGCIWADKNMRPLRIKHADIRYLQQRLAGISKDKLHSMLFNTAKRLMDELKISDELMQQHITAALMELSPKLLHALEINQLELVFVSSKANRIKDVVRFEDGEKMDDELFRAITDEIRQCRFVSDKILIIHKEARSITDLVDILESYCIFADEFYEVFRSFGDTELALLFKKLPTHDIDPKLHFTENEKEWQNNFICFLEEIDANRRTRIKKLADKIDLPFSM